MVVLVGGCSNSYGSEVMGDYDYQNTQSPNFAYGACIASFLDAEYVNVAVPGCNNITIARNIIKWIEDNCIYSSKYNIKDLLVLIGWTESNRYTLEHKGKCYLRLTKLLLKSYLADIDINLDFLRSIDPTKEFSRVFYQHICDGHDDTMIQIFTMLSVDRFLQKNNINYFTFPTRTIKNIYEYKNIVNVLNTKHNFITENTGFTLIKGITTEKEFFAADGHFNKKGQRKAALWVFNQLKQRNII
jgi:hypothetical protein